MNNAIPLLGDLLKAAQKAGADKADIVFAKGASHSLQIRNGKTEESEHSEHTDLGLRVFIGHKTAIVSATELNPKQFPLLAEQAMAMAKVLPEDTYADIVDVSEKTIHTNNLDLFDYDHVEKSADPDLLLDFSRQMEETALSHKGITNSSGASTGVGTNSIALVSSNGFTGQYERSTFSAGISVLAGEGHAMQRDYASHSVTHRLDLENATSLGMEAAQNALARLNPVKPRTAQWPILFHPRVAGSLLGHFVGAIHGGAIARGTSFLKEKMGQQIFPDTITIIDDPTRERGLRSRPFDGEGILSHPLKLVENGRLHHWLLDQRSARQLNLTSNGRAARGVSSPPSPSATNLYFANGVLSPRELMTDIKEGVYITELMGSAINGLTGDYSRGASGFMIRNGEIAEPIAEFTIAGNLNDMFAHITLANDLEFRRGVDSPTLRIETMTIAGA